MRYWKRVGEDGETTTVESYSFDSKISGAVEITKKEFNRFIRNLPARPLPVYRDLAIEIDEIKRYLNI